MRRLDAKGCRVVAIVPAAGFGKRFSSSEKKTFADFSDAPLLIHTLKRLHSVKTITEIIPVLRKEDIQRGFKLIKSHKLNKVKRIAVGGKERQDSVYNALKLIESENPPNPPFVKGGLRGDFYKGGKERLLSDDLILIHDGVRPLVSKELIEKILKEFRRRQADSKIDGVVPGLPLKETLKEIGDKGIVRATKRRERFRSIQTPQVFSFNVLKKAYDSAYREGFYATDDAALVERIGGKVKVIHGHPFNIKVTTPEDAEMLKYLLKNSEQ